MRPKNWEDDEAAWPDDARWQHSQYDGVAWRVYGWHVEPDEDTEWTGIMVRTGQVVAVMVGDDRRFVEDAAYFMRLDDLDYCAVCGQVGCTHDGRERGPHEPR